MITAYRKPLDPSTLVIEMNLMDAAALRGCLPASWATSRELRDRLDAFQDGDEMPLSAEGDGPYVVGRDTNGRDWFVGIQGWGIGSTFTKESIAREAAATLNALVALDQK
jgi:hypothetical protein